MLEVTDRAEAPWTIIRANDNAVRLHKIFHRGSFFQKFRVTYHIKIKIYFAQS